MTRQPPICLIVLAWNRWDLTRCALDTLLRCELEGSDIIVVDNGSTDATPEGLQAYAGRVRSVRLPHNLGFVAGNNAGIALAATDADIVLLNNDIEFVQRDWLPRMRECAYRDNATGIVGCRLTDGTGGLLHAGTRVMPDDGIGVQIASGRVERDVGQYAASERSVEGVVFAVVYIRRAVINAIGDLHGDYVTYAEDSDYCLRAREAGFQTRLCGGVSLVHHQHGSTRDDGVGRAQLLEQGRATFVRHWGEPLRAQYTQQLSLVSALDFPRGTAAWVRPLVRALDAAGVDVRYRHLHAAVLPAAIAESGDSQDHVLNTLRTRAVPAQPSIVVAAGDPMLWPDVVGDYRIGYTGFEQAPSGGDAQSAWAGMDELWVPSAWHRDMLLAAGMRQPVHVMPWGIDPEYVHPGLVAARNPHGEKVFLCIAAWDGIDQPWHLLSAWSRAFRREEPVRLLAWIDASGVDLATVTRALDLDPHGARISLVPQRRLHEEQQHALMAAADAVVSTTRSNDRSLPLLQALGVARPLIAPARGALAELVSAHESWPLPANANDALEDLAIAAARRVLGDWNTANAMALKASARVRRERDWAQTATQIRRRLGEIAPVRVATRIAPRAGRGEVLVLGMHRSGTSCVAGLLQLMGAYGGRAHEFLSNPTDNARGFFERHDLHAACVAVLRERGGDWSVPLGWDATSLESSRAVFRKAIAPILAGLAASAPWFIKEPRLCLLLPEILDLFDAPLIVHVVRPAAAVAASIAARDGLTIPHALALWEHYNRAVLNTSDGLPRVTVDYHALLDCPRESVQRLYRQLLDLGVAGLRLPQDEEIAAWVGPELAHQRHVRALALNEAQIELWRRLGDPGAAHAGVLSAQSEDLLRQVAREHAAVIRREKGLSGNG